MGDAWKNALVIAGIVVGCIAWAMFWAFVMRPLMAA